MYRNHAVSGRIEEVGRLSADLVEENEIVCLDMLVMLDESIALATPE